MRTKNLSKENATRKTLSLVNLVLPLIIFFPILALCQPSIEHKTLNDGVERWHLVKTKDKRPWFFQQVESLFKVALPRENELPFGESVAFLVGISQYDYLEQLPFVQNDLADMREFLLRNGGFDTVYVASEKIANRDLVEEYMRNKFGKWLNKHDRLLFYYSGHGADGGGKTGYLQFAKAQLKNFAGPQVLKINDVSDWSREIDIAHMLFIFDCCASGLAFASKGTMDESYNNMIATLSRAGSRMVMTAGTAEEKTYEIPNHRDGGNGVFTHALISAVESGLADKGRDGFMTIEEVFAQIRNEVAKFSMSNSRHLTPRLWALYEEEFRGTFIFVNPEAKIHNIPLHDDYSQKLNARPRSELSTETGTVKLLSYVSGRIYFDIIYFGEIESGIPKEFYNVLVGYHTLYVKGMEGTAVQKFSAVEGRTVDVTVLPLKIELDNTPPAAPTGLRVTAVEEKKRPFLSLRHTPIDGLSDEDVREFLNQRGFYCNSFLWTDKWSNIKSEFLRGDFELHENNAVVFDHTTRLYWQQAGSLKMMSHAEAQKYIQELNETRFAGYDDWRIPTLEESMSLIQEKGTEHSLFCDRSFDDNQLRIWTADKNASGDSWIVDFRAGACYYGNFLNLTSVRAVRGEQENTRVQR